MDTVQPDTKLHIRLPLDDIIIELWFGRSFARNINGHDTTSLKIWFKIRRKCPSFVPVLKTVFDLRWRA